MATLFMDPIAGVDANNGTTFAARFKTFNVGASAARTAPGDTVRIIASPDPTTLSQQGTFTNNTRSIVLASALNMNVSLCENAWTASANVTTSTSATSKQGTNSTTFAIAAGFTTGLVGYEALAGITDFSAYNQICFWIRSSAAVVANTFRLDLCSDAVGLVAVNSVTINFAINPANVWHAVVIDTGGALSAVVQSIALTALLDPGTIATLFIDNIFVSKAPTHADCITLHSYFSKTLTPSGRAQWHKVQSVNGTTITYEGNVASTPTSTKAYGGSTETVTIYVRQPLVVPIVTATSSTPLGPLQEGGTDGLPITYSGGWDRTAMTTQSGETWMVTPNGTGEHITTASKKYLVFEKLGLGFATSAAAHYTAMNYVTYNDCYMLNCTNAFFMNTNMSGPVWFNRCVAGHVSDFSTSSGAGLFYFKDCTSYLAQGFALGVGSQAVDCTSYDSSAYGFRFLASNTEQEMLIRCQTYGSTTAGWQHNGNVPRNGPVATRDCIIDEATEIVFAGTSTWTDNASIYSMNHDNVPGNNIIFNADYRITSQTAVRDTAAGLAPDVEVLSTNRVATWPVTMKIDQIPLTANNLVTVKAKFRRDNTGLTIGLMIPGNQIDGIASDVLTPMTASANTWEELTVTATPTESGVIDVMMYAYGGTTYHGYVHNQTITQA